MRGQGGGTYSHAACKEEEGVKLCEAHLADRQPEYASSYTGSQAHSVLCGAVFFGEPAGLRLPAVRCWACRRMCS